MKKTRHSRHTMKKKTYHTYADKESEKREKTSPTRHLKKKIKKNRVELDTSAKTTLNTQRTTVNTQHSTHNSQHSTHNTCVVPPLLILSIVSQDNRFPNQR